MAPVPHMLLILVTDTALMQIKTQVLVSNVNSLKFKIALTPTYDTQVMCNGCMRMHSVLLTKPTKDMLWK